MSIKDDEIFNLSQVMDWTSLAESTIYIYMKKGEFPNSFSLLGRRVGWLKAEVFEWIQSRERTKR